jgi:hypothetical protein
MPLDSAPAWGVPPALLTHLIAAAGSAPGGPLGALINGPLGALLGAAAAGVPAYAPPSQEALMDMLRWGSYWRGGM